jgi:maltoporin
VHIADAFFINMSGTGAGVDGIDLGFGKLGVAVFRNDYEKGTSAKYDPALDNGPGLDKGGFVQTDAEHTGGTRLNADLQGIDVNPGGKLRVTATATRFKSPGGKSGFGLSVQHNQAKIFGDVDNTAWIQYAHGSAGLGQNFGSATSDSSNKSFRIVESMTLATGQLTGQALAMYGEDKGDSSKVKNFSLGGRVGYAITKNFKIQGEAGVSTIKPNSGDTQRVAKFTIAPTLTTGPDFYNRPELRVYLSGFSLNDAAVKAQKREKKTFSSVGIQAEMWF